MIDMDSLKNIINRGFSVRVLKINNYYYYFYSNGFEGGCSDGKTECEALGKLLKLFKKSYG